METRIIQNLNIRSLEQNFGKKLFRKNQNDRQFRVISINTNGDFFEKAKRMTPVLEYLENKTDKFQISDYYSLSKKDKQELRNAVTGDINNFAKSNIYIARNLKEYLDKKFGENNYVFVSIGRSPSLIGKTLECMGVETKYLPISGLGDKDLDFDKYLQENSFEKYRKFLKSQGLTKEKMEGSRKTFLFYDYTVSRRSLNNFHRLISEIFEFPEDKMVFRSLNEEFQTLNENGTKRKITEDYARRYLASGKVEEYSFLNYLNAHAIEVADYSANTRTTYGQASANNVKLCIFSIMDKLSTMGLLKENPPNRKSF